MASYDDLNNRQIFTVAILSAALTFITILACQVVYFALAERQEEEKLKQGQYTQGNSVLTSQSDSLNHYGVNEDTGQIQVPVDVVMTQFANQSDSDNKHESQSTDPSET
ncbi:hypothetical protein [Roseimaritima ulvae]|uniref:Uncharacterized protein n=1 Tax=Roseimaritima ulvae TaxID=980254 RepID=A0A5B9QNN6_9BACT|nr:hypothetical protein [Roseimaritima ulvae]QEG40717.1 hypothetical protein UC8_27340 [Roseimaritima ulvae]